MVLGPQLKIRNRQTRRYSLHQKKNTRSSEPKTIHTNTHPSTQTSRKNGSRGELIQVSRHPCRPPATMEHTDTQSNCQSNQMDPPLPTTNQSSIRTIGQTNEEALHHRRYPQNDIRSGRMVYSTKQARRQEEQHGLG